MVGCLVLGVAVDLGFRSLGLGFWFYGLGCLILIVDCCLCFSMSCFNSVVIDACLRVFIA